MPGWLATKCLSSAVSIEDIDKYDNCVCQAVITQINSVGSSHAIRIHASCRSEVNGSSGQFYCQKCSTTHLNEMMNKPGQLVRLSPVFVIIINILLYSSL